MTTVLIEPSTQAWSGPVAIRLPESITLSEEDFYEFCQLNREFKVERTAQGEIVIMPPTGGETGSRNSELNMQLRLWSKGDGRGVVFDSSTGFILPNGADRSPDAAQKTRAGSSGREKSRAFSTT